MEPPVFPINYVHYSHRSTLHNEFIAKQHQYHVYIGCGKSENVMLFEKYKPK